MNKNLKYIIKKNVNKVLNESFGNDSTPEEVYQQFMNLRSNIMEMPNGDYVYVAYDPDKNEMYCGGATNAGIIPSYRLEYDLSQSLDYNLNGLYDMLLNSGDFEEDEDTQLEGIIRENVKRVIKENSESTYEKLQSVNTILSDITTSGFIPFASPSPSSTERELRNSIYKAITEVQNALYLCQQLGYK